MSILPDALAPLARLMAGGQIPSQRKLEQKQTGLASAADSNGNASALQRRHSGHHIRGYSRQQCTLRA
jgi:hypothetical protein